MPAVKPDARSGRSRSLLGLPLLDFSLTRGAGHQATTGGMRPVCKWAESLRPLPDSLGKIGRGLNSWLTLGVRSRTRQRRLLQPSELLHLTDAGPRQRA